MMPPNSEADNRKEETMQTPQTAAPRRDRSRPGVIEHLFPRDTISGYPGGRFGAPIAAAVTLLVNVYALSILAGVLLKYLFHQLG
jgi:hypothetical protein